jgi:hypothetical protein
MWWNLIGMAVKTGAEVYKNKKESEALESQARRLHYERMAKGEIEYSGQIAKQSKRRLERRIYFTFNQSNRYAWLCSLVSITQHTWRQMKLFFLYFSDLPFWYQTIFVGVVSASLYGLKATDI